MKDEQPKNVKLRDLADAVDFVSGSDIGDSQAWVCVQSGKVYWYFDEGISGEVNDDLPEDIDDEEKYLPVPNKRDLDLGRELAIDFARRFLPGDLGDVRDMFHRRGAYRRFRQLLTYRNAVQQWYDFEAAETERVLKEWCELNSVAIAD